MANTALPATHSTPRVPRTPAYGIVTRLRSWYLRSEAVRGFSLLSPTMLLMLLMLAMPLGVLFTLSFWEQDYLDFIKTFSLANYLAFFEKPIYSRILIKS
ncbi:MAG: hypothetical protein OEU26_36140, partial [Candidatus Tectomicrobia bacterium]|nr:hypothetical protein [Candidatus Tectomicrobia bacterium]